MQADIDGAIRIASMADEYDWQWTSGSAEQFCRAAQFQMDRRNPEVAILQTSLKVSPPIGLVMSNREFLAQEGEPDQSVVQISVRVTDTGDESDPRLHVSLVDLFSELSKSFIAEWGSPTRTSPGELAEIGWELGEVTMMLSSSDSSIQLDLVNPVYLNWWDAVAEDDEDSDEDDGADEDDETSGQNSPRSTSLTWGDRRNALTAAVTRLPNGAELVLTTPGGHSIAFTMDECQLISQVAVDCGRCDQKSYNETWFTTNGWKLSPGTPQPRWERSISWPAAYREYEAIVDAAILVLRDPLQIENPEDLTVEVL
ncbi:DUF6301 family protein [Nocardia sp. NBC_01388]|uniref:DUF6301 family protein n=1 Tax=Nocardia sp. NBC_01388 TaxID=2903596 RepID=UPI0032445682